MAEASTEVVVQLRNAVDITNLHLHNATTFEYEPRRRQEAPEEETPGSIVGPCQKAYSSSWTAEEKAQMVRSYLRSDHVPGATLSLDVRIRRAIQELYKGADRGCFSYTIEACEEGWLQRRVGSRGGSAGILLRIERVLSFSDTVLLEASFNHTRREDVNDELMQQLVSRLRAGGGALGQLYLNERELQELLQLLVANRQLLHKGCVKQAEKDLNRGIRQRPWRVTVLTPFKPRDALRAARHARAAIKSERSCVVCGATENLKSCVRCQSVSYCSKECQTADWKAGHKRTCGKAAAAVPPTPLEVAMAELRVGDQVTVSGLQGAVELNGACGTLVDFKEETGRWAVQLPCGSKLIKSANLVQDVGVAAEQNKLLACPQQVPYEESQLWLSASSCLLPIEASETELWCQQSFPGWGPAGQNNAIRLNGEPADADLNKIHTNVHDSNVFVIKVQYRPSMAQTEWINDMRQGRIFESMISYQKLKTADMGPPAAAAASSADAQNAKPPPDTLMIYDMLRSVLLLVEDTEVGARKEAFDKLKLLAQARGGDVGLTKKVYLFAQRLGPQVRVFLQRLPVQSQPF